ncbi:hypothetical protein [Lutispora thermophila]|uniref:Uncharacterized protein n=1 Tax=Lutispora thermophila DSM 19022 TaxID=1122184 RepID=A0A1M6BDY6_9FIRM|nr:hypothetical protein [Lutispora thermophila]SHI46960.1 hypothetical protein SAMN02745176_00417 [Lutispora thermophila DSM 19022]
MRITHEKYTDLSLIYVYLREYDGINVDTIQCVNTFLLFDRVDNWIGFEVFNILEDGSKVELPALPYIYFPKRKEVVKMNKNRILILFDSNSIAFRRIHTDCNIDYNKNGLQGFEFILTGIKGDFDNKTDIFKE